MRVNIGCGATPTAGWVNLDNSLAVRVARQPLLRQPLLRRGLRAAGVLTGPSAELAELAAERGIRYADGVRRIPCRDRSVDALYSAHMIEHLDSGEARRFLREVRRVLRPGGVVRLAAPDLALLVGEYRRTGDADEFMASTHLGLTRPAGLAGRVRAVVVGPRHHLWMYDGDSLAALLGRAGFTGATILPPGETTIGDPGQLDLKERAHESVYAEARNPG